MAKLGLFKVLGALGELTELLVNVNSYKATLAEFELQLRNGIAQNEPVLVTLNPAQQKNVLKVVVGLGKLLTKLGNKLT